MHSNHLVLFGLSEKHDIFLKIKEGVFDPSNIKVTFDRKNKPSKLENTQKISGKKKHNAVQLDAKTLVCEIRCGYTAEYLKTLSEPPAHETKLYKIRSFLDNAKIVELNERVMESNDIFIQKPESDGFLAIFQLDTLYEND